MDRVLPNRLRTRREKIFGPVPSHPFDRNAKGMRWQEGGATHRAPAAGAHNGN
jgi:hypothetical protein